MWPILKHFRKTKPPANHVELFCSEGVRTVNFRLPPAEMDQYRRAWRDFVKKIGAPPPMLEDSRGIVICGGGVRFLTCAWVNIRVLRHHGCTLPVELWHLNNEITADFRTELQKWGVECRNLNEIASVDKDPLARSNKNYAMKPLCILHSRFTQVLYLDADNICATDPTYLFDHEIFKAQGAVFWPDFWKTGTQNPIWDLIDDRSFGLFEQDSGQILIDKLKCWNELNLCCYFNCQGQLYYRMLHYDKDTFKFAWLALKKPFFMVPFETASCGYIAQDGNFVGITMVQYDYSGKIIFLHRNIIKWDVTRNGEILWQEIRKFKRSARTKEYHLGRRTSAGENGMDLRGDIEILEFIQFFPEIEALCLKFLRELRESPAYARYLIAFYLQRCRGGSLTG